MPVSELLKKYYSRGGGMELKGRDRFKEFVLRASPPIPYQTAKDGTVTLGADATDAIYDAIRSAANMFLTESGADGKGLLKRYDRATHDMAELFARFLSTGLAKGDASWR